MKSIVLFALLAAAVHPTEVRVIGDGGLQIGETVIEVQAYEAGWKSCSRTVAWKEIEKPSKPFYIGRSGSSDFFFRGQSEWQKAGAKSVSGVVTLRCLKDVELQTLALTVKIPAAATVGRAWSADSKTGKVPADGEKGFGRGKAASLSLPLPGGQNMKVLFDSPTSYSAQDGRRWGDYWFVRLGDRQTPKKYLKGDVIKLPLRIELDGDVDLISSHPCEIKESAEWVKLDYHKDIVEGSALDFSTMGLQDAPAGKYGWLKAVGGDFRFEGLPDKSQRFYGVNLCFTANYPEHDVADAFVTRLSRLGYNAIRVHHHDGGWLDDANKEKLDYLLAACYKKGIYVTTDLFVSRPIKWRDIGVDRDGVMDKQAFKVLVGCNENAFRNWCEFAKSFLEHVNPYTGRAMKDEPGMPFISLINEGKAGMHWHDAGNDTNEDVLATWHELGGEGPLPKVNSKEFNSFDEKLNRKIFEKCSAYLRSIGCKALLTNDNNGSNHTPSNSSTVLYDYVDNHFYVDHPRFLVKRWNLPSSCGNRNPVLTGGPDMFKKGYGKSSWKPYTITEWNFSAPGRYRGIGGIMTGALASIQDWDGLWRFAYAHRAEELVDDPSRPMSYFNLAVDPVAQASDRASICLFLRRDVTAPDELALDKETGVMKLVSPRTCAVFTSGGTETAGALKVEVSEAPATIWVSSLDGEALADSKHVLLTHITEIQGNGTKFSDDSRSTLLKWGTTPLIMAGKAQVTLAMNGKAKCKVYELDTAGNRVREIKARTSGGKLQLEVSTNGPSGGRMCYEIVR